jgi:hypothetical protein
MAFYVRLRSPKSITVSGLFMRPHRARLSDKNLCQLMFLKYNERPYPKMLHSANSQIQIVVK